MAGSIDRTVQTHCRLIKSGRLHETSVFSLLLKLYTESRDLESAIALLRETPRRDIISWNTVISASSSSTFSSFFLLREMMIEGTRPDHVTLIGVLRSCAYTGNRMHGRQAHCVVFNLGLCSHRFVSTAMLDTYAKLGLPNDARSLFDEMPIRDLVTFNTMIYGYACNNLCLQALEILKLMGEEDVRGDEHTFSSLMHACVFNLQLGEQVHCQAIKLCSFSDLVLLVATGDMYAKSGAMEEAERCFFSGAHLSQSVVPWNSIIVGHGRSSGGGIQPVKLLRLMLRRGINPDEITSSSVFRSCGGSAMAGELFQLHALTVKLGLDGYLSTCNSMIGAYGKCGSADDAFRVFSLISRPDVVSFGSVISACAAHGRGEEALQILEMMRLAGVKPDEIALLQVLAACSHAGLVEVGLGCFVRMVEEHGLNPSVEHYSVLVGLLGRAGLLHDATRVLGMVLKLPGGDERSHLGSFISLCRMHGSSKLAEMVAGLLLRLRLSDPLSFLDMGSIYAAGGAWDNAKRARKMMSFITALPNDGGGVNGELPSVGRRTSEEVDVLGTGIADLVEEA
ncbi:pentatricopeptide repeat-containing protein At2g46050, mitochondrial-like [Wolffia australiana]